MLTHGLVVKIRSQMQVKVIFAIFTNLLTIACDFDDYIHVLSQISAHSNVILFK